MSKYNVDDELLFHSENGQTYKVIVENVDTNSEPSLMYATSLIDENGATYYETFGDFFFCGDDFLDKCERVKNEEE